MTGWHAGPLASFYVFASDAGPQARMAYAGYVTQQSPHSATHYWQFTVETDDEQRFDAGSAALRASQASARVAPSAAETLAPLVVWDAPFTLTVLDQERQRAGLAPLDLDGRCIIDPYVLACGTEMIRPGQGLYDLCAQLSIMVSPGAAGYAIAALRLAREIGRRQPGIGMLSLDGLTAGQQLTAVQEAEENPAWERGRWWPLVPRDKRPAPDTASVSRVKQDACRQAQNRLVRAALLRTAADLAPHQDEDDLDGRSTLVDWDLALFAQELVTAVGELPAAEQPGGWAR